MHIERKIIIVLSVLLLIAVASIAVMIANNKTSSSVDSTVNLKNNSLNQSSQEPTNIITPVEIKKPLFDIIANGSNGGDVERGNYILKKATEWKDLWTKINYYNSPIPPVPDVNFSKEMVVALFAGRKYTSGYYIEVSHIDEKVDGITVFVKEYSPGVNCLTSQVLTYPFNIVKIPRTEKEIGFNTEEVVLNC
ncbi:MAG: protease complex subunit PrcB family protein [Candidatus Aenigmarchaeota archaeon]|nr:protease complex subunit PrcB family protein [Candidatus Aenigmarchaeota archaeon]